MSVNNYYPSYEEQLNGNVSQLLLSKHLNAVLFEIENVNGRYIHVPIDVYGIVIDLNKIVRYSKQNLDNLINFGFGSQEYYEPCINALKSIPNYVCVIEENNNELKQMIEKNHFEKIMGQEIEFISLESFCQSYLYESSKFVSFTDCYTSNVQQEYHQIFVTNNQNENGSYSNECTNKINSASNKSVKEREEKNSQSYENKRNSLESQQDVSNCLLASLFTFGNGFSVVFKKSKRNKEFMKFSIYSICSNFLSYDDEKLKKELEEEIYIGNKRTTKTISINKRQNYIKHEIHNLICYQMRLLLGKDQNEPIENRFNFQKMMTKTSTDDAMYTSFKLKSVPLRISDGIQIFEVNDIKDHISSVMAELAGNAQFLEITDDPQCDEKCVRVGKKRKKIVAKTTFLTELFEKMQIIQ